MDVNCIIRHPGHGCLVELYPDPAGAFHLAAWGVADPTITVAGGDLFDHTGARVCPSRSAHRKGGCWVLSFLLPAGTALPPNARYRLVVRHDGGRCIATARNIRLINAGARAGVTIVSPTANDTVCPDFTAYGTAAAAGALTATLTDGAGAVVATGAPVDPAPNWTVMFSGLVAPQQNLTLSVNVAGVGGDNKGGLLVLGCIGGSL